MNKFNILYESILNKIINENSMLKESKFKFSRDDDMNILCVFSILRNGEKYIVNTNVVNNKFNFIVTDEAGNTKNMTKKEFAAEYYLDYNDYIEAYEKYKDEQESIDEIDPENGTNVKPFNDVLTAVENSDGLSDERTYSIGGVNFVFRMLDDELVSNYCECLFQSVNDENELEYFKALIFLKPVNSVIVKIIKFDNKDNMKAPMMGNDLLKENKDLYNKLMKAITKMGKYILNK